MPIIIVLLAALASGPLDDKEPKTLFRPDLIETLVNPACSHCVDESRRKAGDLRDDDRVLSWIRGKYDGGAIPYRWFLVPYRVISDTYGVFVYDADADFVRGYPASLDYRFHGWRNGVMVMRHKDGTLFDCLTGLAFDGPRKGEQLAAIPTVETDWGPWLKANPGTVAYAMVAKFQPHSAPKLPLPESRKTRPESDPRLDAEERVFGLAVGEASRAWPLRSFGVSPGLQTASLGGKKAVILWDGRTRTAAAYAPETDGEAPEPATLVVDANDPESSWVDKETGSRWSVVGRAVSGPRKGQTLRWLPGVMVKWYAWAASYPKTSVEKPGGSEPTDASAKPIRGVLMDARGATAGALASWKAEGGTAVLVPLDESIGRDRWGELATSAERAGLALYPWVEVGRNPVMAEAHPEWMAAPGGHHDDWRRRFPDAPAKKPGWVIKAWPWVPIGYAPAFEAHRERLKRLLDDLPGPWAGVFLNDLQAGPSSCGCGNDLCRWALDYGSPSTASKTPGDDAAARLVTELQGRHPGKAVIPVWVTECETRDLPGVEESTGRCGGVECAKNDCWPRYARSLKPLLEATPGPLAVALWPGPLGRESGWVKAGLSAFAHPPKDGPDVPTRRTIALLQAWDKPVSERSALADKAKPAGGGWVMATVKVEQSWEPRLVRLAK